MKMTGVPLKYIYEYVMHKNTVSPMIISMVEAWYFGKVYDYTLGTPFDTAKFLAKAPYKIDNENANIIECFLHVCSDPEAYIEYLRKCMKYCNKYIDDFDRRVQDKYIPEVLYMTPMQVAKAIIYRPKLFVEHIDRILEDFNAYLYVMKHTSVFNRTLCTAFKRLVIPSHIKRQFNDLPEYIRVTYSDKINGIYRSGHRLNIHKHLVVSDGEARRLVDYPKYACRYLLESYKVVRPSTRKLLINAIRSYPKYYMKVYEKYISRKKRNIMKIINKDINTIKNYLYYNSTIVVEKWGSCREYTEIIMNNPHLAFETYDYVYGLGYCIHEELDHEHMTIYHKSILQDIKTTIKYLGIIDNLWEPGLKLVLQDSRYTIMYLMAMQHNYEDKYIELKVPRNVLKYVTNDRESLKEMLNMDAYTFNKNKYCKFDDLFNAARDIDTPYTINIY